jgi:hypothetical protein
MNSYHSQAASWNSVNPKTVFILECKTFCIIDIAWWWRPSLKDALSPTPVIFFWFCLYTEYQLVFLAFSFKMMCYVWCVTYWQQVWFWFCLYTERLFPSKWCVTYDVLRIGNKCELILIFKFPSKWCVTYDVLHIGNKCELILILKEVGVALAAGALEVQG